MIFNTKHEANWEFIRKRKQQIIEKNNEAENAKRIPHTYNIGDKVLIRRGTENKYEAESAQYFRWFLCNRSIHSLSNILASLAIC
jgi:hypothetical protein